MTDDDHHPVELRIAPGGARLDISWADGAQSRLSAHGLRAASRSAGSLRSRIDIGVVDAPAAVTITGAEAVGSYALRLFFSDGHDRGIYPWRYLRDLAA